MASPRKGDKVYCRKHRGVFALTSREDVINVKCSTTHCPVARTFGARATVTASTIATSHALRLGHVVRVWLSSKPDDVKIYGKVRDENPLF